LIANPTGKTQAGKVQAAKWGALYGRHTRSGLHRAALGLGPHEREPGAQNPVGSKYAKRHGACSRRNQHHKIHRIYHKFRFASLSLDLKVLPRGTDVLPGYLKYYLKLLVDRLHSGLDRGPRQSDCSDSLRSFAKLTSECVDQRDTSAKVSPASDIDSIPGHGKGQAQVYRSSPVVHPTLRSHAQAHSSSLDAGHCLPRADGLHKYPSQGLIGDNGS
jgi:hypothetical protein